jgi:hypothetical protein
MAVVGRKRFRIKWENPDEKTKIRDGSVSPSDMGSGWGTGRDNFGPGAAGTVERGKSLAMVR